MASLLIGLLIFWPRISITPIDPVDPANRFSVAFTVTNTGMVPLEKVTPNMCLGEIAGSAVPFNPPTVFDGNSCMNRPEWVNHRLSPDERFTFTLLDFIHYSKPEYFGGADIVIAVDYRVWKIPYILRKRFRFTTKRQSDGQPYWYSSPLE